MSEKEHLFEQQSHKFVNVVTKVRNRVLGNDSAWDEAQPLFSFFVGSYPDSYQDHFDLLRRVFNLRRNAFLEKIQTSEASDEIKKLVLELDPEAQEKLTGMIVCIRDLFNRPVLAKGKRRG